MIDEADRLADLGFMDDVRELLDAMPPQRQTLLFSATLDGDVDELIKNYQKDPVMVDLIGEQPDATPATHHIQIVRPIEKTGAAANLVREFGRTVVFVRTREGADSVRESLQASGVQAGSIHGGMSQGQRERSLEAFRHGRVDALVATDVAARGIHRPRSADGADAAAHNGFDDFDATDDAPAIKARPGQHGGVKTVSQLAARPRVRGRRPQSRRPS